MSRGFFKYVYSAKCVFNEKKEDLRDIETHVVKIVTILLHEIEKREPSFKMSSLVPTGSYYEETKVRIPDEFDYMVVLDPTVFGDSIHLGSGCEIFPWFRHIDVFNPKKDMGDVPFVVMGDIVRHPRLVEMNFWIKVAEVLAFKNISVNTVFGSLTITSTKLHKLYLEYIQSNKVAPMFQSPTEEMNNGAIICLNKLEIGVDLMLAFEHPTPEDVARNPMFPVEYQEKLLAQKCHLVSKSCHQWNKSSKGNEHLRISCRCWFISFAIMETSLMKDMDDEHRKYYKILKSLLIGDISYPGKCMNLSSYVLKTAMFHHVYGETACREMRYETCIPNILRYLKDGFESVSMPCFFARTFNVWGSVVNAPILSRSFDKSEVGTPTTYSMLWVEFWRRLMMVIMEILERPSNRNMHCWASVMETLANVRYLVTFLLGEYHEAKKDQGLALVSTEGVSISPFENVPSDVKEKFPQYIRDWLQIVSCAKFDINRLIEIDSV